ncbi:hypothetical protein F5Y18DRAFT_405165 [Xylariaceae sp. FL1019]|nr:hypothetical protein F5Y18DRAFT_405165 [Xylariaceae sp. FL1019]
MHHGVAHPSAFSTPVLPTWDDPWGGAKPVKLVNKEQRLISAQRARAASMAVFIPPTDFANASRRQTKLGRQNTAIDALTKEIEAHYTLQRQRLRLVNPDLSLTQQQHTPILNGPTAQSAPGADDSDWQDVLMAIDDPKLRDKAHAIMQGKGKGKGPAGPDGN